MTDTKEKIEDGFLSFLYVEYMKEKNMLNGNPYWSQLKRDFSNVYTNEISCYVHFERSGVSLVDSYQYDVRKLLGYMTSIGVISFSGGLSVGSALKQMDRKETELNFIINSNSTRVVTELKNLTGLMRSRGVKLNAFKFIRDMYNWSAQESNDNKNWVRKSWVKNYIEHKKVG